MLSALSASAVAHWHPPPTPPLTAVALHPPPPLPNACAHLGLSRKLDGVRRLCPSSTSFALLPCPTPRLLLPSFIGMATVIAVAPSHIADCCVFFITCTPSSLSFVLHHAIMGSCNVESHLKKSSINSSSTDFNPTAIWDVVKPCPANATVPTPSSHGRHDTALIMGKSMLENAIEATSPHPPYAGQGGQVRTHAEGGQARRKSSCAGSASGNSAFWTAGLT